MGCWCNSFFTVYALNVFFSTVGTSSSSLLGWTSSSQGDPCADNWEGVICVGPNITELYVFLYLNNHIYMYKFCLMAILCGHLFDAFRMTFVHFHLLFDKNISRSQLINIVNVTSISFHGWIIKISLAFLESWCGLFLSKN